MHTVQLTPATSWTAGPDNYCYWDRSPARKPYDNPALIFDTVEDFARRIYDDYGWETAQTTGEPLGYWRIGDNTDWPQHMGQFCRIGAAGFNWLRLHEEDGNYSRFPHIGGVTFGDRVTIENNVTIDRGGVGDTIIERDVHIDSHVHIGHNASIGQGTIITAGAIIGGGAVLGHDVYVGLGAIVRNKIYIGAGATIGMGAVVVKNVPAGETWVGNPARKLR